MEPLHRRDLAYIQATAFGWLARGATPEIIRVLKSAPVPIKRVVDVGCGAGPLSAALAEAGFEVTGVDPSSELLAIAREASHISATSRIIGGYTEFLSRLVLAVHPERRISKGLRTCRVPTCKCRKQDFVAPEAKSIDAHLVCARIWFEGAVRDSRLRYMFLHPP